MARKKNTAHRPATPWMEYVLTRDKRRVKNTAFDPNHPKAGRSRTTGKSDESISNTAKRNIDISDEIKAVSKILEDTSRVPAGFTGRELSLNVSDEAMKLQKRIENIGSAIESQLSDTISDEIGEIAYKRLVDSSKKEHVDRIDRVNRINADGRKIKKEMKSGWYKLYNSIKGSGGVYTKESVAATYSMTPGELDDKASSLNRLIDEHNDRIKKSRGNDFPSSKKLADLRSKHIRQILPDKSFGNVKVDIHENSSKKAANSVVSGLSVFTDSMVDRINNFGTMYVASRSSGGGGRFREEDGIYAKKQTLRGEPVVIADGVGCSIETGDYSTSIHELSHAVECGGSNSIYNMSLAYVNSLDNKREGGHAVPQRIDKDQLMFATNEKGSDVDKYTNVVYANSRSTEVLSTGMETVFGGGERTSIGNEKLMNHTLGMMAVI